jgi:hypothetical protein
MPGKKIGLLGSNLHTNNTCAFGSMAGLAPTSTVRPWISGIHGYKYSRTAANGLDWATGNTLPKDAANYAGGCGLAKDYTGARSCKNGRACIDLINPNLSVVVQHRTGKRHF